MSYELVNRITIKKDGVYISSHSNNDTAPFHSHRFEHLSKIYFEEGELQLDAALVSHFLEICEMRGEHPSVQRFRKVFESDAFEKLRKMRDEKIEARFAELPENIRTEIECLSTKTTEAIAFFDFEKDVDYQFCLAVAKLLPPRKQVPVKDLKGICWKLAIFFYHLEERLQLVHCMVYIQAVVYTMVWISPVPSVHLLLLATQERSLK